MHFGSIPELLVVIGLQVVQMVLSALNHRNVATVNDQLSLLNGKKN